MGKRTVTAELLPAEEYVEAEFKSQQPTASEQMEDEWSDFLGTGGESAFIYVYRQPGNGQTAFEFVDSFPADQFEPAALMKRLRQEFGGGNYRVQIRHGGRVKANKLMAVAAALKPQNPGGSGDPALMAMLEEMREMRREMLAEKKTENKSPMEQMKENLSMMVMMKEVFGGQQKSALSELKDLLAMKNELAELVGPGRDDESGGNTWLGPLLNALPTLVQAATARPVVPLRPNPQPRPVNPQPQGTPDMPLNTEALTPEQKQVVAQYLGQAVMAASWGMSAETVADKVIERIDEAQAERIAALLVVPDLLDEAAKIVPDVAKYRDWFADLLEWLKAHLALPSKYASEFADEGAIDAPEGEVLPAVDSEQ